MSDNIGKPLDYSPGTYSNDPNAHTTGGYTEERLSKLEYHQQDLRNDMLNINLGYCLCCKDPLQLVFPICNSCTDVLGSITRAKRDLKFLI